MPKSLVFRFRHLDFRYWCQASAWWQLLECRKMAITPEGRQREMIPEVLQRGGLDVTAETLTGQIAGHFA